MWGDSTEEVTRRERMEKLEMEANRHAAFLRQLLTEAEALSLPDPIVPYELTTFDRALLIFGKIQP